MNMRRFLLVGLAAACMVSAPAMGGTNDEQAPGEDPRTAPFVQQIELQRSALKQEMLRSGVDEAAMSQAIDTIENFIRNYTRHAIKYTTTDESARLNQYIEAKLVQQLEELGVRSNLIAPSVAQWTVNQIALTHVQMEIEAVSPSSTESASGQSGQRER